MASTTGNQTCTRVGSTGRRKDSYSAVLSVKCWSRFRTQRRPIKPKRDGDAPEIIHEGGRTVWLGNGREGRGGGGGRGDGGVGN